MRHFLIASAVVAALAACSNGEKTARYLIDPPVSGERLPNRLGTTELKDVSLPEYASGDEVSWQSADGAVRSNTKRLWADNPQRAFTLTLARAISDLSGATVIAEPWPLAEPPRRRVEVRVEKALAQRDGVYRLSGAYYVSNDAAGGANHARRFDIAVALPVAQRSAGSAGLGGILGRGTTAIAPPGAIAAAQDQAIAQLARQIAVLGGPGATVATTAPRLDPIFSAPFEALPPLEPLPAIELEPVG